MVERHGPDVWRRTALDLRSTPENGRIGTVGAGVTNGNGAALLGDSRDLFRPKPADIPSRPGVYKWRDGDGRVIYVGKAKSLRSRLANYFQPLDQLHPRTQTMVLTARALEWTVVGTELEALTLEYTWIKEFDPRFNVVFRDDKTYPYLAVSAGEQVPRVWITRSRKRRDSRYFGPYAKVWDLRHSLDGLLKAFPVRTCASGTFRKARLTGRACLLASIGKCSAPCIGRIGIQEHRDLCGRIVGVLTGRLGDSYIAGLTREMRQAASDLEFEKAAKLRDDIGMLRTVVERNAVVFERDVDADVFGMACDELEASVHAFFVRSGSIRGERNWSVRRMEDIDDHELIADLVAQVYADLAGEQGKGRVAEGADDGLIGVRGRTALAIARNRDALGAAQHLTARDSNARARATRDRRERQERTGRDDLLAPMSPVPKEVIVPVEPAQREQLEDLLSHMRGGSVTIRVASRGEKRALMERANENAGQALARSKMSRVSDIGARTQAMNEVAKALGMEHAPLRIECYDISNTVSGAFQVASMVVFEDGIAKKSEYRRFSIRGADGRGALDDLGALRETLTRRFRHGDAQSDSDTQSDGGAHGSNGRDGTDAPRTVCEAESTTGQDVIAAPGRRDDSPQEGTVSTPDGSVVGTADTRRTKMVGRENARQRHFAYKPNLVVIDGGQPQVMAAARALADCGVDDVVVCSLAKRLEEVWVPDDDYPIVLSRQSEGMYLLQRVRDEAHRFAIAYHRQARRKGALHSALDEIPGIGEAYRKRLLREFGSVRALRQADVERLEAVKGIGHARAQSIYRSLHRSGSDAAPQGRQP